MSSPTTQAEILALAFSGQENFVPARGLEPLRAFLPLAPTTSASYPSTPVAKSPSLSSPAQIPGNNALPDSAPAPEQVDELLKSRRSSSLGSDGASQKKGYLKLGPVHFGEGDGKGDWSENVIEE